MRLRRLLLGLQIGFRRRRIHRARRHRAHEIGFALGIACRRRRPWAVDALRPDGIDRKPVTGPAQRYGALPAQTFLIDHQRRLRAIVRYAYRPGRNAQQAVVKVDGLLFRGHPEVVDADDKTSRLHPRHVVPKPAQAHSHSKFCIVLSLYATDDDFGYRLA